ncbi:MAG TPA: aminodeoxychorismate/anthranilate synthase component II [Candidatus Blautia intestinavium]|nr:aminodeoxychorismate/anthranilate synthase component II [Candidatus Blautia intestinavium]
MIILIDNYDSFSYNLYQLAGSVEPDIRVIRNDRYTVQEIAEMEPEALILSPGPGRPENAGICIEAVRYFTGRIPILGVCLGHQAICEAFGGKVSYAGELMHGKQRTIYVKEKSRLFDGMGDSFPAARYHSLAAAKEEFPEALKITAESEDGEIMAVEHREFPVFGVQFHPESVMTPQGRRIIENFMKTADKRSRDGK